MRSIEIICGCKSMNARLFCLLQTSGLLTRVCELDDRPEWMRDC